MLVQFPGFSYLDFELSYVLAVQLLEKPWTALVWASRHLWDPEIRCAAILDFFLKASSSIHALYKEPKLLTLSFGFCSVGLMPKRGVLQWQTNWYLSPLLDLVLHSFTTFEQPPTPGSYVFEEYISTTPSSTLCEPDWSLMKANWKC